MSSENSLNKNLQVPNNEPNEVSLKDIFLKVRQFNKYLLSKWKILILAIIIGCVLGFVYSQVKKPIYTATTTFVLEEGEKGGGLLSQYGGLASMVGMGSADGSGGIFQGDNIIQLYQSRSMVQKALLSNISINGKTQLLIDRYIDMKRLRDEWANSSIRELKNINFNIGTGNLTRLQDSILGDAVKEINKNHLFVNKPDKKLSIIIVQVKAIDEIFAAQFNNQIVKTVNDFYIQTKSGKALQNLAILQHQTDSVKAVLNSAIYQAAAINDATPNLNITRQVLRTPVQRSQFNADANKAILSQLVQNLELAKISLRKDTPLIQVIDTPIYPLDKEKLGKIKAIVLGGFFGCFIVVMVLLLAKLYKKIKVLTDTKQN
ncbi:Wzz/FepE/Etk N-terminal domain-containing protein [Mucilaginibacter polytrichastri]|uniref:Polysaccharide chain length determinant N-terminal domain-containing protein n=1 Tax=Mucilaginibacter polytrichastri TaxID=1302689 RepID=A0A1Q5ZYW9_9SPHI|nr:Wzz/FepE/Etk N-terminal domain-containing protein [Mucilaginibacter polytrichastri]OKS86946.1 hypothetical protein RG47T_2404 [Mucilaginibacter polytrichastri]SFS84781.1 Chain length determinant protein [Mucilaginibacter polytrichastri]